MESASARLGQVWSELKAVARQLQATHRSKTSNSVGVFQHLRCHATLRIACVIFTLTAPRTDLALEFWKFKRRNKPDADKWTEKDMLVQFNGFTIIEKHRMLNASDKRWNGHSATGKAWLREQGLRDWVYGQNTSRGVAPANEHLWKETCLACQGCYWSPSPRKDPEVETQASEPVGPAMGYTLPCAAGCLQG